MFRFLTCGESHGKMLSVIIEGLPSGIEITEEEISNELSKRQKGYGRGERSKTIEKDIAEIIAGVRWGLTTGAPIGILIENKDWKNRIEEMSPYIQYKNMSKKITRPRPGHADLPGMLKYNLFDSKPILERASARNTASLVAIGAICKKFLKYFNIETIAYVKSIKNIEIQKKIDFNNLTQLKMDIENSLVRCPDQEISKQMIKLIDETKEKGDSLGGKININIFGIVPGIGSHIEYDKRLDANLAQILMGIPSVKSVNIGLENPDKNFGSSYHDEIEFNENKYYHLSNNAGGIEGGISNGEPIQISISLKPIPTLYNPLNTIDIETKEKTKAEIVRSDVAVAPSAVIVSEAMVNIKLTEFYLEKFGGDNIDETLKNFENFLQILAKH